MDASYSSAIGIRHCALKSAETPYISYQVRLKIYQASVMARVECLGVRIKCRDPCWCQCRVSVSVSVSVSVPVSVSVSVSFGVGVSVSASIHTGTSLQYPVHQLVSG